jgi:DNA polymerase II small subunit
MNTQEIIAFYLDNGVLMGPDIVSEIDTSPLPLNTSFSVINKDILKQLTSKKYVDIENFEKAIVLKEKNKNSKMYNKFIEHLSKDGAEINKSIQSKENTLKNLKNVISKIENKSKETTNDLLSSKTDSISNSTEEIFTESNSVDIQESEISSKNIEKNIIEQNILSKEKFMVEKKLKIVSSYDSKTRKWTVQDFVSLYRARYRDLEKILRSRSELQSLTSISKITSKKERENVALIGVVYDKAVSKTGNIILTIEDPTGMIKTVVNKSKEELFKLAEEIQLDEVIGVTGLYDNIIFCNALLIPDIPLTKELKKSPEEGYFVVIADTEPGSKLFLEKEFNKFLSWISGEVGSDKQKDVASKVKYLFIGGDLVNGVGIYPNQEFDLNIIDIRDQYKALAELLKKVPSHIPIIICPGNHDVGRISEPQPALSGEYVQSLLDLPNLISVSNPSILNIYAQPEAGFDGFDVMFYHGYSFIYYSENVPLIRKSGGQKRPDLIMKYLLQRRHLAPTHTSTLYIPDPKKDPLVIDKVPDFLLSGHVHRAMVSNYKNVTCINASCWTGQSEEQERRGLEAQPARAFIVDMHTREVKIMNFMSRDEVEKESGEKESN